MSPHFAFPTQPCLLLLAAALMGPTISAGIAFGRDANRVERIRGDDDPILIPRWVASGSFTLHPHAISDLDPESTGSVKSRREGLGRAVTHSSGSQTGSQVMTCGKLVEGHAALKPNRR